MLTIHHPKAASAHHTVRALLVVGLVLFFVASPLAQNLPDVTAMSVEDLMNVQVTSVSKRTQKLADAAAAIFVITQEDIRRSGATSIPEALRMVPGLQVARIDENKWAISSRGFNGRFANKLLVLIDGRSVYTPLFSGVYWNIQDVMLEDVDRIEVIRGPGATLWGANAVNGVINIITKPAKSTQSALATAGGGTETRGFGSVRYGGRLNTGSYYRAYAKYFNVGPSIDPSTGRRADDNWDALRGGFRTDWTPAGADSLTVQGDIHRIPIRGASAEGIFWAVGITPSRIPRRLCRCIMTAQTLPRIRFLQTIKTFSTLISSIPSTPANHKKSYGGLVTAPVVMGMTPALQFRCSQTTSR